MEAPLPRNLYLDSDEEEEDLGHPHKPKQCMGFNRLFCNAKAKANGLCGSCNLHKQQHREKLVVEQLRQEEAEVRREERRLDLLAKMAEARARMGRARQETQMKHRQQMARIR